MHRNTCRSHKASLEKRYVNLAKLKFLSFKDFMLIMKSITIVTKELSKLELNMEKAGIEVIFTPEEHYEIASRGIKYLLGISKVLFHRKNTILDNNKHVNNLKPRASNLSCNMPLEAMQRYC